jgi:hypothetical protein
MAQNCAAFGEQDRRDHIVKTGEPPPRDHRRLKRAREDGSYHVWLLHETHALIAAMHFGKIRRLAQVVAYSATPSGWEGPIVAPGFFRALQWRTN